MTSFNSVSQDDLNPTKLDPDNNTKATNPPKDDVETNKDVDDIVEYIISTDSKEQLDTR